MSHFDYVSKPVVVQAFRLCDLNGTTTHRIPSWLMPAITDGTINVKGMQVNTRQGPVKFKEDDWLIRLEDGEIYPCSDEVFQKKYEQLPASQAV